MEGKCYSPEESYDVAKHPYGELKDDIAEYNSYMYKGEKPKISSNTKSIHIRVYISAIVNRFAVADLF